MKVLTHKENFLGIDEYCSYEQSRVVIQPLAYEETSSYRIGSKKGPRAILEASQYVELYDEECDRETYRHCGIATIPPIRDFGQIYSQTKHLLNDDKFVVSLGGEHTITLPVVQAHVEKHPDLTVVQFDAHSDLRDTYENNKYSHACVMRRLHDEGIHLSQIGIRAQCIEEAQLIQGSSNIDTVYMHEICADPKLLFREFNKIHDDVYITVDADGFDPSVIPSVGTAEPGGLTWYEVLNFISRLAQERNVIGFDVVEMIPSSDSVSQYTLAKLIYKIIGRVV